ncbi:hypothetical protein Tco_0237977 [Tanacetum coccineum]
MKCSLCSSCMDSNEHLFFKCPYSERIWEALKIRIHGNDIPNDWNSLVNIMSRRFHNRSIKSILSKIVFGAAVYVVWQERNRRLFTSVKRNVNDLLENLGYVNLRWHWEGLRWVKFLGIVSHERWDYLVLGGFGNVVMELWSGAYWVKNLWLDLDADPKI